MPEKSVEETLGWSEDYAKRVRKITGLLGLILLFCGVICQWVAASRMSGVPLGLLCKAYSGMDDLNDIDSWTKFKYEFYNNRDSQGVLDLADVAYEFSTLPQRPDANYPLDNLLGSLPSFWCKHLPECPAGTSCAGNSIVYVNASWARGGVWEGRPVTTEPHWNIAAESMGFYGNPIRCRDKTKVFHDMLMAIHTTISGEWTEDPATEARWSEDAVNRASTEFLHSCQASKGSLGYILACGPVFSSLACVVCAFVLFRQPSSSTDKKCGGCCDSTLGANIGQGLAIMAVAMALIGFWVIAYEVSQEIGQSYMFCSGAPNVLVKDGVYFDDTSCADVNSDGEKSMNPFLNFQFGVTALYTAGGTCNIIATFLLVVAISKMNESSKLMQFKNFEGRDEDDDDL